MLVKKKFVGEKKRGECYRGWLTGGPIFSELWNQFPGFGLKKGNPLWEVEYIKMLLLRGIKLGTQGGFKKNAAILKNRTPLG